MHFDGSLVVQFFEFIAVLLHIVIFTNPSIFQADDYSLIRSFLLNVLLLACIWSDMKLGKRFRKHYKEVQYEAKINAGASVKTTDQGAVPSSDTSLAEKEDVQRKKSQDGDDKKKGKQEKRRN